MKGADAGNVAQTVPAVGPAGVPPGVCKEGWRDSRVAAGEQTALRARMPAGPAAGTGCATPRSRLCHVPRPALFGPTFNHTRVKPGLKCWLELN